MHWIVHFEIISVVSSTLYEYNHQKTNKQQGRGSAEGGRSQPQNRKRWFMWDSPDLGVVGGVEAQGRGTS